MSSAGKLASNDSIGSGFTPVRTTLNNMFALIGESNLHALLIGLSIRLFPLRLSLRNDGRTPDPQACYSAHSGPKKMH